MLEKTVQKLKANLPNYILVFSTFLDIQFALQVKLNYKDSKNFVKTKLMLSERLKFMIKHQTSKTTQQISNSEGNIVTRDARNRSSEGVLFRSQFPRARPSSFCLPSDYLEHWEEILAAAKLPSRLVTQLRRSLGFVRRIFG